MSGLAMGDGLTMPVSAVTEKFGIVGVTKSGKTNTAVVLVEELRAAGAPVIVTDPTGVWWGLRSNGAGDGPGVPIYILGGPHADLPITPTSGAVLADLVVDRGYSAVLDVSQLLRSEQIRFLHAFYDRLYTAKTQSRSPLHLVIDEAQLVVPQIPRLGKAQNDLLEAASRLIQQGRVYGIGVTMITQRPALVNKDVWYMAETLFALRTTGKADRDSVNDWLDAHTEIPDRKALIQALPKQQDGEALVLSPHFLQTARTVQIRRRWTYDSGRTPVLGETLPDPKPLAPAELEHLRAEIAATVQEAEANDPAALRSQVAELQRQLRERPPAEPLTREVPVVDLETLLRMEAVASSILDPLNELHVHAMMLRNQVQLVIIHQEALEEGQEPPALPQFHPAPQPVSVLAPETWLAKAGPARQNRAAVSAVLAPPSPVTPEPARPAPSAPQGVSKYGTELLRTLACYHPMRLTLRQWSTLARKSLKSSSFDAALRELKRDELVTHDGERYSLTDAGWAVAGRQPTVSAATAGQQLRSVWLRTLPTGPAKFLKALLEVYPKGLSEDGLCQRTNSSPTSSSVGGNLRELRAQGLVEKHRVQGHIVYRVSAELFPDQ